MKIKQILLSVILATAIVGTAMAQPRAIGARIGGGADFSYQHSFASRNMIDMSVGVSGFWGNYGYADVNCMFDWVFNISGGWNWYVGPGLGLGCYWGQHYGKTPVRVNLGAQIGVEYQFNIPLNLSLDFRPMTNVLGYGENYYLDWWTIALGVRYRL